MSSIDSDRFHNGKHLHSLPIALGTQVVNLQRRTVVARRWVLVRIRQLDWNDDPQQGPRPGLRLDLQTPAEKCGALANPLQAEAQPSLRTSLDVTNVEPLPVILHLDRNPSPENGEVHTY